MGYLIILPILILMIIPFPTAFSQQESALLRKICTNTSSHGHEHDYTDDSPYAKNVKVLLDDLFKNTPKNKYLFSNKSVPSQDPKDQTIYGLALCRGDVSSDDCDFCLYDARCKITQRCDKKSASIFYDNCQVRYSAVNFFGKLDLDPNNDLVLYNTDNVSTGSEKMFQGKSIGLLEKLRKQAIAKSNKHMFARGDIFVEFNQTSNATIYGMAQCTLDLSPATCDKCLDQAVKKLPIYNGGIYTVGARFLGESCAVRYEIYTFLEDNNKKKA